MATDNPDKNEEEKAVDNALRDLPQELRKRLKKKKKPPNSAGSWAERQREEIAQREKIKPFS